MIYDFLVVGSGLAGASLTRMLLDSGHSVIVVEKRHEFGGNVYTHVEDGIILHDYGPHIFHTSYEDVWEFVNKHCEMYPFVNSPLANYHDELYHLPFNMNTFHELWGVKTPEEAMAKIKEESEIEHIEEPKNLEEQALKLVGRTIYTKLIKGYTEKQWGRDCKDLPASIIKRLPLRFTYDNNYFNDTYQGLPKGGYSVLIDNLLKGATLVNDTDYLKEKNKFDSMAKTIVYTGRIDEFFSFEDGHLDYRSLRFEKKKLDVDVAQHNPVINFTAREVPYTRINEAKLFDPYCENKNSTFLTYEYPDTFQEGKIPYYTLNDERNTNLYKNYADKALKLAPRFLFLGRLANYRYFDMDDTILEAKKLFDRLK
ncbi:MAG: UDP-galactopyranose mutase [Bacilli bacterium]|jgi:UDP-galactopyranose mutase|nr:UDP-galactopyranose mutase [Bacilli bacterium]MCH4210305.1 UDP-galactopyranose mutase [Bacilli bacterium]MCH4228718.1 UDP-galactopyranose mutase [Bacilli bacterium]MCH4278335.1 UDP-galactopyranose mutase [Bacilli bacterium]MCI2054795.1 UDP-galactopyranose mutase [Bacilli bacterium]